MSVVAALSESLVHTNRRLEGSWTQTYAYGIPVTDLVPVPEAPDAIRTTGTTVRFRPAGEPRVCEAGRLGTWRHLDVVVENEDGDRPRASLG